jgi:hypothetical protein
VPPKRCDAGLGLRTELRGAGLSLWVEQPDELLPLRRGGRWCVQADLGCTSCATGQTRTSGSLDALDVLARRHGAPIGSAVAMGERVRRSPVGMVHRGPLWPRQRPGILPPPPGAIKTASLLASATRFVANLLRLTHSDWRQRQPGLLVPVPLDRLGGTLPGTSRWDGLRRLRDHSGRAAVAGGSCHGAIRPAVTASKKSIAAAVAASAQVLAKSTGVPSHAIPDGIFPSDYVRNESGR